MPGISNIERWCRQHFHGVMKLFFSWVIKTRTLRRRADVWGESIGKRHPTQVCTVTCTQCFADEYYVTQTIFSHHKWVLLFWGNNLMHCTETEKNKSWNILLLNFHFIAAEHFMKGDVEFLIFHLFSQYMASISCSHTHFPGLLDVIFFSTPSKSSGMLSWSGPNHVFIIAYLILKLGPSLESQKSGKVWFSWWCFSQYISVSPPNQILSFWFLFFLLLPPTPTFYEMVYFLSFLLWVSKEQRSTCFISATVIFKLVFAILMSLWMRNMTFNHLAKNMCVCLFVTRKEKTNMWRSPWRSSFGSEIIPACSWVFLSETEMRLSVREQGRVTVIGGDYVIGSNGPSVIWCSEGQSHWY